MDKQRLEAIKALWNAAQTNVGVDHEFVWQASDIVGELIAEVERLQAIESQYESTMKWLETKGLRKVVVLRKIAVETEA